MDTKASRLIGLIRFVKHPTEPNGVAGGADPARGLLGKAASFDDGGHVDELVRTCRFNVTEPSVGLASGDRLVRNNRKANDMAREGSGFWTVTLRTPLRDIAVAGTEPTMRATETNSVGTEPESMRTTASS